MKISTLVQGLQGVLREEGDLEVVISVDPEGNGFVALPPKQLEVSFGNLEPVGKFRSRLVDGKPRSKTGAVALWAWANVDPEF